MATECQLPFTDDDEKMLQEAEERGTVIPECFTEPDPEVERAILQRAEELGKERVDKSIEQASGKEHPKELTPEQAEKFLKDEIDSLRKEIRQDIAGLEHIDEERYDEQGERIAGISASHKLSGPDYEKTGWKITTYSHTGEKDPVIGVKKTDKHEVADIEWDYMAPEQQQQWKERFSKAKQRLEEAQRDNPDKLEDVIKEHFPTAYATKNEREYRAECMAEFKWEPENLKGIDEETFNVARQEYIDNEIERVKEQLVEGGHISPHSLFK